MIRFDSVTKRYPGGHDALQNLSLEIAEGEMVFLAGHSGAGKSTLLKLIAAIERPTSGSVLVNNQNVGKMRRGVRVLQQGRDVLELHPWHRPVRNRADAGFQIAIESWPDTRIDAAVI